MPVTAPADRRFRRAHLKPGRKRAGWAWWRWRAAAAAVLVGLGGYAAHRGLVGIVQLPVFRVQRIVVHGNRRLSNGEVLSILEGLRGQSVLTVDLDRWRDALLTSPWVAEALLRRTLPATIDVLVQERHPLGIGRINGALY